MPWRRKPAAGRVPASTPRALSRDVTECRSGITARALAAPRDGAAYADGVGARSIIVRGMKHDGPPAIVRETHSREVGHGTTRGSQLYTPPRHSTLLSCRPLVSSASTLSRSVQRRLPSSPPRLSSFLSFALFSVHNTIRTVSLCYVWGSLKCAMIHISSPGCSPDNSSHSICTICSNRPGGADSRIVCLVGTRVLHPAPTSFRCTDNFRRVADNSTVRTRPLVDDVPREAKSEP